MILVLRSRRSFAVLDALWKLLWFWLSARASLPLLFSVNLYWVSAFSVIVSLGIGMLFGLYWLLRPRRLDSKVGAWAFTYLGWVAFISVLSPNVADDWLRTSGFFLSNVSLLIAILLGSRFLAPERAITIAARSFVLGLTVTTFVLLLLGSPIYSTRFGDAYLLSPNTLAFMYAIALLFLLFFTVYKAISFRVFLVMSFALALVLTFSKTALIATVIALIVANSLKPGWHKVISTAVNLAGAAIILLVTGDYLKQQLQDYLANPHLASTLTGRTILWGWVLERVSERPWTGYGYGTFRDVFEPYSQAMGFLIPATQAHNAYLDALFVAGYPGLFLFGFAVLRAAWIILKAARSFGGTSWPPLFMAFLTFLLIRSMVEGALNLSTDFQVLMGIAFVAEALVRPSRQKSHFESWKKRRRRHFVSTAQ